MCKAKDYSENLLQTYNKIEIDFNELSKELKQVTLYEQDLLHIIEKGGFNASEGYTLAKKLCDNRQNRRKIKNELTIIKISAVYPPTVNININCVAIANNKN